MEKQFLLRVRRLTGKAWGGAEVEWLPRAPQMSFCRAPRDECESLASRKYIKAAWPQIPHQN